MLKKLSEAAYQTRRCFSSQSDRALEIIHAVLVEGRQMTAVAREHDVSPQLVDGYLRTFTRPARMRARYDLAQLKNLFRGSPYRGKDRNALMLYWHNGFSVAYISLTTGVSREHLMLLVANSRKKVTYNLLPSDAAVNPPLALHPSLLAKYKAQVNPTLS